MKVVQYEQSSRMGSRRSYLTRNWVEEEPEEADRSAGGKTQRNGNRRRFRFPPTLADDGRKRAWRNDAIGHVRP